MVGLGSVSITFISSSSTSSISNSLYTSSNFKSSEISFAALMSLEPLTPTQKHLNCSPEFWQILAITDESIPPENKIPKGSLDVFLIVDSFRALVMFFFCSYYIGFSL